MSTKKVLITGAAGFIGSHVVEKCVKAGWKVKAMIRYNSTNNWGWLEGLSCLDDVEIVPGDVSSFESARNAMSGCDTVLHLAALIGIPYSFQNPHQYIKTNIEGTYNILQSALDKGVDNVVITSTSETYGTAQRVPIDENHPCHAQSPYAATKIAADQLGLSYYNSFGLPVKIIRPFNTFGPRQSARAIIPTIISQALNSNTIKLGNLTPTRDLLFVEDTADGFLSVAMSDRCIGHAVNLGTGEEVSIGNLAQKIADIMECEIDIQEDLTRKRQTNAEVERLVCSNKKISEFTGWHPKWRLNDGLQATIHWIKQNREKYKANVYSI